MLTCAIVRPKYQELYVNKRPPLCYNKTSSWTTMLVTSVFPDHRQHKGGRVSFESVLRDFNASWQEGRWVEAQGGGTWQCDRAGNREGVGKGLIDNLRRSLTSASYSSWLKTCSRPPTIPPARGRGARACHELAYISDSNYMRLFWIKCLKTFQPHGCFAVHEKIRFWMTWKH